MLTVDYDRLGVRAGERVLDIGCGFGRHSFEALRHGAAVVACDVANDELAKVAAVAMAMADAGEIDGPVWAAVARGDATALPFPDVSFDRVIASEVLEHIPEDAAALAELARVLRPGGVLAVTVPAWLSETICWKLSDEYHAPKQVGGHVRVYRKGGVLELLTGAGLTPLGSHGAHALHSPYWWLRCAVGPDDDDHPVVRPYKRLLEWDIMHAPTATRVAERLLNPVIAKSLVVYAYKPREEARAAA